MGVMSLYLSSFKVLISAPSIVIVFYDLIYMIGVPVL
jgi:hypothetical protein